MYTFGQTSFNPCTTVQLLSRYPSRVGSRDHTVPFIRNINHARREPSPSLHFSDHSQQFSFGSGPKISHKTTPFFLFYPLTAILFSWAKPGAEINPISISQLVHLAKLQLVSGNKAWAQRLGESEGMAWEYRLSLGVFLECARHIKEMIE